MKIGIVLSKPPSYSETFFNSKIKGLQSHGFNVLLFVQKNDKCFDSCTVEVVPNIYKNGFKQAVQTLLVFVKLLPYTKKVIRFLKLEKQSGRNLKQRFKNILTNAHLLKAEVDWLHFGFTTLALQSENVAIAINAKMAVSCRGYDMDVFPLKQPKAYQLLWHKVDKVHVISKYMKTKALENGMKPTTRVSIITPAINLTKFRTNKQRNRNEILQLTTIARLHWIKGLLPTLEGLSMLKKNGIRFNYQIIGDGPQYEALAFAIHQLDLNNEVELIGKLNQTQIIRRLQDTDIYLQYSHSEGFCNAVLEAQAMGCLCVVSDGGALPENVLHQKTGIVVPKNNPKVLAQTLKDVINGDAVAKQNVITNAKQRVQKEFNLDRQAQKFKEFYRNN